MHEPKNKQPRPDKTVTPVESEARVENMIREGRMPSLEEFVEAIVAGREEYVRSLKEEGAIPPDYEPQGLVDVLQELLRARAAREHARPVSIGDYEHVRDELRDFIGPGGFRHGITRAKRQDVTVPIRKAVDSALRMEHEHDLSVRNEGTIVVFTPNTEAGRCFLRDMLHSEPWQWLGENLCVDHRMACGVLDGAENEGLSIGFLDERGGLL